MDYEMTLSHLEIVRKHVAQGERHVTNQRAVVRELEEDGHDTSQASALLAQFEGLQSMHIAHMERLEKALLKFEPSEIANQQESGGLKTELKSDA